MKFTFVKIDKNKQIKISTKKLTKLVERIATDDNKLTVTRFRQAIQSSPQSRGFKAFPEIGTMTRIYPSAEFTKDNYGRMKMEVFNGLLLITLQTITPDDDIASAKASAAALPYTFAAIVGADGKSLTLLVRIANPDGTIPSDERGADKLCRETYEIAKPAYEDVTGMTVDDTTPSVRNSFLITIDEAPYLNENATPLSLQNLTTPVGAPLACAHEESPVGMGLRPHPTTAVPNPTDPVGATLVVARNNTKDSVDRMIDFLSRKYDLRYNSVIRATEYRLKDSEDIFELADPRVQNRMIIQSKQEDIDIDANNLKTYLESDLVVNYDPIEEYLSSCRGKWDGVDHIRNLALTVPSTTKEWTDWFYTWFLAFVHQMDTHRTDSFSNSIMPIIIGEKSANVETFYRNLLPPELSWGYCDYISAESETDIEKALSKSILICLKDFNHTKHELKERFFNVLIDKTAVKDDGDDYIPRIASFVGTSDIIQLMNQTSGGRHFFGITLSGAIYISHKPDCTQLYAQALAALEDGQSPYFSDDCLLGILKHNVNFQSLTATEMYFNEFFSPAKSKADGEFLTSAEIMDYLRERTGFPLDVESNVAFGRKLSGIDGIVSRRIARGVEYLVTKIK